MKRGISSCAAGLFVLAAFCLPATAEESPIQFLSGPFAGATPFSASHREESLHAGKMTTDTAKFSAGNLTAYVDWSRISLDYVWTDFSVLDDWIDGLRRLFKASGVTVLDSDRVTVNGFLAQYKLVIFTGADRRCGAFVVSRIRHRFIGYACGPQAQQIPVRAVLEGLAVDGVIGP
jgi:hypothetical protein